MVEHSLEKETFGALKTLLIHIDIVFCQYVENLDINVVQSVTKQHQRNSNRANEYRTGPVPLTQTRTQDPRRRPKTKTQDEDPRLTPKDKQQDQDTRHKTQDQDPRPRPNTKTQDQDRRPRPKLREMI